jgi:putative NIF3 family GTP cyclohydrolase 1 type 2
MEFVCELSTAYPVKLTMNPHFPFLSDIKDFLYTEFATERYPANEQGGIFTPSEQPIERIGLTLDPFPDLANWVQEYNLDALWIHRPFQLSQLHDLPNLGVLSHHLPFDEALTMGYNRLMAERMGVTNSPEPIGYKQDVDTTGVLLAQRPIGMLVDVAEREFDEWLHTIKTEFGGYDRAEAGHSLAGWQPHSSRIAVVGAMTDALVREAAERGAHLYLTGAYRKPAQLAVDQTGIAVIAIGHRRTEEWGLQLLADLLEDRWSIECFIHGQTRKQVINHS